ANSVLGRAPFDRLRPVKRREGAVDGIVEATETLARARPDFSTRILEDAGHNIIGDAVGFARIVPVVSEGVGRAVIAVESALGADPENAMPVHQQGPDDLVGGPAWRSLNRHRGR